MKNWAILTLSVLSIAWICGCSQNLKFEQQPIPPDPFYDLSPAQVPPPSVTPSPTPGPTPPPPEIRLLGSCEVTTPPTPPGAYGIHNSINSGSGGCTPPAGTINTTMTFAMDDGGTISVNGQQVYRADNTCVIKYGDNVPVTMQAGAWNTVDIVAVNCGLAWVYARTRFDFYGY